MSSDPCYIVAGGPSLKGFDWSMLDGKFVIAINRAYEVLPNAQIVYFTDPDYWERHEGAMRQHGGQLVRGMVKPTPIEGVQVYELTGPDGLETKPGCLRHGSNSTYAATNLAAVHLGFKRIYLLGVDMKRRGDETHWHDGHKRIDNPSVFQKMTKSWNTIADPLKQIGVDVWNANPDSALECFPKCTIEQALADNTNDL